MKDPIPIEHAKVLIYPSTGAQSLPMLIVKFPHGSVSFDLSDHKRGRIRTLNNSAQKEIGPTSDGVEVIRAERERQLRDKGYSPEHDDEHDLGELALAAALYALPYDAKVGPEPLLKQDDFIALHIALETGCGFYVDPEPDKLRRLAKAGALIAAEIDRLKRASN